MTAQPAESNHAFKWGVRFPTAESPYFPTRLLVVFCLVSSCVSLLAFMYNGRGPVLETKSVQYPCWTSTEYRSTSDRHEVFKCRTGERQANYTIESHEELTLGGGDYNTPWFHAATKLSLCWIPKVGSSKTKLAWAYLTGVVNEAEIHRHHPKSVNLRQLSLDDVNHVFSSDSDWVNVVVVRDPAERFISGYLDKVVSTRWFNKNGTYNATAESVLRFLNRPNLMATDHFAPQSKYCGLRQLGSAWNRLVIHSRYGMAEKMSQASDGRLDAVLQGPGGLPSSRSIYGTGTGHETRESSDHVTLMKELCCSDFGQSVLDRVVDFFQEDYERFPFPAKDWRESGICGAIPCNVD